MLPMNDEFYVGYQPQAPRSIGRFMKFSVLALLVLGACIALLLVINQSPFAPSSFVFQQFRGYEGIVLERPYPMLVTGSRQFLLVAPGKHGAASLFSGRDGQAVSIEGALIQRGENSMLEIRPESMRASASNSPPAPARTLGHFTLRGEVVDTKYHLGVMNPGSGKVHRDCAIRCISGGIPPGLFVRDAQGQEGTLVLANLDGKALGREVLEFAAEPVRISGGLYLVGKILVFKVDLKTLGKE